MYSQALLQAHPEPPPLSPLAPGATPGGQRKRLRSGAAKGKENIPPGQASAKPGGHGRGGDDGPRAFGLRHPPVPEKAPATPVKAAEAPAKTAPAAEGGTPAAAAVAAAATTAAAIPPAAAKAVAKPAAAAAAETATSAAAVAKALSTPKTAIAAAATDGVIGGGGGDHPTLAAAAAKADPKKASSNQVPPRANQATSTADAAAAAAAAVTAASAAATVVRKKEMVGVSSGIRRAALEPTVAPLGQHQTDNAANRDTPPNRALHKPIEAEKEAPGKVGASGKIGVRMAAATVAAPGSVSGRQDGSGSGGGGGGGGASLTEKQRQKMLENRAKALARLKEKQQASSGKQRATVGAPTQSSQSVHNTQSMQSTQGMQHTQSVQNMQSMPATQGQTQNQTHRERFRMTMDIDSGEDSDVESGAAGAARNLAQGPGRSASASVAPPPTSSLVLPPSKPSGSAPGVAAKAAAAKAAAAKALAVTVPLSAPRAGALEQLSRELRSRAGMVVHAAPLGGGLRDVDLVVGAQCAVCVRGRRQFLAQTHSLPSSPSPKWRGAGGAVGAAAAEGSGAEAVGGGAGAGCGAAAAAAAGLTVVPLVALLKECLQRYARVVVVVEGLQGSLATAADGGGGGGGDGGGVVGGDEEYREAVEKVEALRGVSVMASRGWKDTADKVMALVEREKSDGVGLPREVRTFPQMDERKSERGGGGRAGGWGTGRRVHSFHA